MPRQILKTRAVVLRSRNLGDTSKLVTLFTEEYGKMKAVAKGARKPKNPFAGALELTNEIQAVCYVRPERDLQTLSDCDLVRSFPALRRDLSRLALASAAGELVERLTVDLEPNPRLFACLAGILGGLQEVGPGQTEPLFWYFQLRLAAALGYRPELRLCATCGGELTAGAGAWFSPAAGGAQCERCGPQSGQRVAPASLRLLADLQALRTYARDAMPETPPGRAEIASMLRLFLAYHGGQGDLKSLEFLESIRRSAAPAPAHGSLDPP